MRASKARPSYPPISRFGRLGLVSAVFIPVLALALLRPSVASMSRYPQELPADVGLFRINPGLLTSRGGRTPDPDVEPSAPAARTAQPAVSIYLHVRGTSSQIRTSGTTLREGLSQAGIFPRSSDMVRPSPELPLQDGMHVYMQESVPVVVYADGAVSSHYTLQPTVGQALAEMGVMTGEQDRVQPGLDSLVLGATTVKIVRVSNELLTEEEVIDYRVLRQPSEDMEINTEALEQDGEDGALKRTIRVDYEDGQEVGREIEKEWVDKPPVPKITLYGTKIIWRTIDTSSGPVKYRQKLGMMATSYDASGGGKSRNNPAYGITATGMTAGRGVVAVDPRVIPLYTRLYVPGYGLAIAGDTGGAIIGNRIDLGFSEGETNQWATRWVDVYILD
ncbi:MAG: G5 domain-containing protein [Dehalococcoidia bacterium]|nr:G5 domain-containing protein [Dehalococcoidia bacterium]